MIYAFKKKSNCSSPKLSQKSVGFSILNLPASYWDLRGSPHEKKNHHKRPSFHSFPDPQVARDLRASWSSSESPWASSKPPAPRAARRCNGRRKRKDGGAPGGKIRDFTRKKTVTLRCVMAEHDWKIRRVYASSVIFHWKASFLEDSQ